jgi:predicted transcriptional regulator
LTVVIDGVMVVNEMSIPELVGELVQRYGSLNAASRKTDIPLTTLYRLYSGEHKDMRVDTLRKIAVGLDISLAEAGAKLDGDGEGAGQA